MLTGGVDTGSTFYTPLRRRLQRFRPRVIPTALGIFITGFSSILTGLNFIVTIHSACAPGLTWFRLPLFIFDVIYTTSIIMVLSTPVIAITVVLLLGAPERPSSIGIFDPALGGDPAVLPAPVLVLLPSGGLHHDFARAWAW